MSPNSPKQPSDEELLANAIPIEEMEEVEEVAEAKPAPAAKPAPKGTAMPSTGMPSTSSGAHLGTAVDKPIDVIAPIDMDETEAVAQPKAIRTFGKQMLHEDKWSRSPNTTGTGAIHVRTFVAKLRLDAIENMDKDINTWLDNHPQYEVKFVTASVGNLTGKLTEPALFLSVWV